MINIKFSMRLIKRNSNSSKMYATGILKKQNKCDGKEYVMKQEKMQSVMVLRPKSICKVTFKVKNSQY